MAIVPLFIYLHCRRSEMEIAKNKIFKNLKVEVAKNNNEIF